MVEQIMDYSENIWDLTLNHLKNIVDEKNFQTWFGSTKFMSYEDNTLTVGVPDSFNKSWLQTNYFDTINEAVSSVASKDISVNFNIYKNPRQEEIVEVQIEEEVTSPSSCNLNPKYTFVNFVIGETNRFAHAASKAVSDPTSKSYNPLFIYGGVGLGKTHLMQAIGHQLIKNYPKAKVLYVTSEQFMNSFIESIAKNNHAEFRNNFRNVDLLLIDDVEFFAGKERTQEEFFHTFNALHSVGKKIVVTSDRPPKEIATLEERLRNRFEWGLTVDIQSPDLETRVAILKKKAAVDQIEFPNDVILFIAEKIKTNIRELEGSLLKIAAYSNVHGCDINIALAKELLGDQLVSDYSDKAIIERTQKTVCEYFDISVSEMNGQLRKKKFAVPRHIAQYLCRETTNFSYPEIGRYFGNRDHTSVLHACKKIEQDLIADSNMRNIMNYLKRKIGEKA